MDPDTRKDQDADGLDDGWETANFGNLAANPRDDPDFDGNQNATEQIIHQYRAWERCSRIEEHNG